MNIPASDYGSGNDAYVNLDDVKTATPQLYQSAEGWVSGPMNGQVIATSTPLDDAGIQNYAEARATDQFSEYTAAAGVTQSY